MHWQTELLGKYEGFAQLLLLVYPIVLFIIGKGTRNNKVCMGTYVGVATKVLRSRDIKRYLFSEIWCLLACCGHTQSIFLTKFVHFRFMSVIPSNFVQKSALFGQSNDSEWSIFDKTRYLERVEGYLVHDDIFLAKVFRTDDRLSGLAEEGVDLGGVGPALDDAPSIEFDCWLRRN